MHPLKYQNKHIYFKVPKVKQNVKIFRIDINPYMVPLDEADEVLKPARPLLSPEKGLF